MKPEKALKYLEQGGLVCPFCGSWDIAGGSMDFDAGEIAQRISCHECNEQWTDVYKLAVVADPDSGATIASIAIQAE
jgi:formate dehydrogenase maturation protein FdhE